MLKTKPFPTYDEYDPLNAHLDELEEPGIDYLQDFIVAPQKLQILPPLSHSNGYTSEESDNSVVTPSAEQNMSDQTSNPFKLVDGVVDVSSCDFTTVNPQQEQQKFGEKVIKGKTSKYRGVTQTSKTSWGAKYSAKRITNTCKTPEEAAHAYDEYLKTNYPLKYAKFANFCGKCGKFVNPLGLPQFQFECKCSTSPLAGSSVRESSIISPKKAILPRKQISTPTPSTSSQIPPTAPSPAAEPFTVLTHGSLFTMETSRHSLDLNLNPAGEEDAFGPGHCSSIMSAGSLKCGLIDNTDHFFADVVELATDLDGAAQEDPQEQPQDQKRDSLPIAIITSAVDSFTQEGNLDQIIKDIHHSSFSHSLIKETSVGMCEGSSSLNSSSATGSSSVSDGTMSDTNRMNPIQIEHMTNNSLDFDVDELDELTKYFMWENDATAVVQRESQIDSARMQEKLAMAGRRPLFKKIHSLEFDADNSVTENLSCSEVAINEIKTEDTGMVNSLVTTHVPANSGSMVSPCLASINIVTQFLDKYWRNDRKNIQCFPYCPEHGDYYRVRIENLQHRCKGVCRAPVRAHVCISAPASASVAKSGLLVLARCNSTFSRDLTLTGQQVLSLPEMKRLQAVSAVGIIDNFELFDEGVQFGVTFHPDVWKFELDLPKKRRHVQSSSSTVSVYGTDSDVGGDPASAEFLYFFEIDVFYSREKTTFERLGHTESMSFQIGNTRTLLRQRNKLIEEVNSTEESEIHANDSDKLANSDELPEKKRVKVLRGRHEILPGTSFSEIGRGSRELSESRKSIGCILEDGVSMLSKRDFVDDKSASLEVDEITSSDSKNSMSGCEAGSSELSVAKFDLWKEGDTENLLQPSVSDYSSYVSPKHSECGNVLTAYSPVSVVIPNRAFSNARPVIPVSPAKEKVSSLAKLLAYSLVCVPLSVLFIPVGIILLIIFLVLPPAASSIVSALDAMSDMELARANVSCTSEDQRMVLNRLIEDKGDVVENVKDGLFYYHGRGDVWGRIFYFSGAKFVVSIVSLIPAFVLTLLASLLYPIRPASSAVAKSACGCALWSREYTRMATGKPLAYVGGLNAVV